VPARGGPGACQHGQLQRAPRQRSLKRALRVLRLHGTAPETPLPGTIYPPGCDLLLPPTPWRARLCCPSEPPPMISSKNLKKPQKRRPGSAALVAPRRNRWSVGARCSPRFASWRGEAGGRCEETRVRREPTSRGHRAASVCAADGSLIPLRHLVVEIKAGSCSTLPTDTSRRSGRGIGWESEKKTPNPVLFSAELKAAWSAWV